LNPGGTRKKSEKMQLLLQISNSISMLCWYKYINHLWAWLWVEQWVWPSGSDWVSRFIPTSFSFPEKLYATCSGAYLILNALPATSALVRALIVNTSAVFDCIHQLVLKASLIPRPANGLPQHKWKLVFAYVRSQCIV